MSMTTIRPSSTITTSLSSRVAAKEARRLSSSSSSCRAALCDYGSTNICDRGVVSEDVEEEEKEGEQSSLLLLRAKTTTTTSTTTMNNADDSIMNDYDVNDYGEMLRRHQQQQQQPKRQRRQRRSNILFGSVIIVLCIIVLLTLGVRNNNGVITTITTLGSSSSSLIGQRSNNKMMSLFDSNDDDDDEDSDDDDYYYDEEDDGSFNDKKSSIVDIRNLPMEGKSKKKKEKKSKVKEGKTSDYDYDWNSSSGISNNIPIVKERCDWIINVFTEKYANNNVKEKKLRKQYKKQSKDSNVFYRATAGIFWIDYVIGGWGDVLQFQNLIDYGIHAQHSDGTPLQPKSTWTWITGDQHLSNFGAWKNRNNDIVFSVNDFDEAAIYDFQVDVLRIAVSVCSHAITNGLNDNDIHEALSAFTDTYVQTLINYVGGDRELLFELTPKTSTGKLQSFLKDINHKDSPQKQLKKFTERVTIINKNNDNTTTKTVTRRFIRNKKTKLISVSNEVEQQIRDQFTIKNYGSTMMKIGWHSLDWDDHYFQILDIAARIGSGVGSYGVDRYYVLLRGNDDDDLMGAIILDVKYEPPGAVSNVLNAADTAWYNVLFQNDAERAIEAQRRLTSYVDPFTGWILLPNRHHNTTTNDINNKEKVEVLQSFIVRQRSPWKSSPNLDLLTNTNDFINFIEQIAIATATSHARGTAAKSPGQFKHVIASVLGRWSARKIWGQIITQVAIQYRQQVLLDFQCFKQYVDTKYNNNDNDNYDYDSNTTTTTTNGTITTTSNSTTTKTTR